MEIHIYLHNDKLEKMISQLITRVNSMDAATQTALDNLNNAVAKETTVENSVVTLLNGLSAQILELKNQSGSPEVVAALQAAADLVTGNTQKLADAVALNTPAA